MPTIKQKIAKAVKEGKITDEKTLATFLMVEELQQRLDEEIPQIKNILKKVKGDTGPKGNKGEKGDRGEQGVVGKDGKNGLNGKDGLNGKTPTIDASKIALEASNRVLDEVLPKIPTIEQVEAEIPKLGHEIRDSLELLTGNERLDKSAIKGLEEIEKLAKQPKILGGGGGSIARNFYQLFDVPQSYTGQTGKYIRVNFTETALEFNQIDLSVYVPYTGATADVDLGLWELSAANVFLYNDGAIDFYSDAGITQIGEFMGLGAGLYGFIDDSINWYGILDFSGITTSNKTFTFPNVSGTVALTTIVDDTIYGASWNADTTHAPTKNAVYDKIESLSTVYEPADANIVKISEIDTFAELDVIVADKSLVNKEDGAVWLGVHDFGGATSLEVPNGAGGTTVDAAGEVCIDTTSKTLNFYDGTVEAVLTPIQSKSITVENPTASEDLSMFFTDEAITVTKIVAVLVGSATPSVTWTIRHGTDRSAAGAEVVTSGTATTSVTTGSVVTSFNDATIIADSFVWLETTAQSGTVGQINITIFYKQDA